MTTGEKPPRFAWARLNADGLFVALLMIITGAYDFFLPEFNPIVANGNPHEIVFVQGRAVGYAVAGLIILYSLLAGKIKQEVVGRFVFVGAVTFQLWRRWLEFHDPLHPAIATVFLLWVIFIGASYLRLRVLLSKDGMTVTIPPRKEPQGYEGSE